MAWQTMPRRCVGTCAAQGQSVVEDFIDVCLSIENLIDPMSLFIARNPQSLAQVSRRRRKKLLGFPAKGYMEEYINPPEFMEAQRKKLAEEQQEAEEVSGRACSGTFSSSCSMLRPWPTGSATA